MISFKKILHSNYFKKISLVLIMSFIGTFTLFASLNTYEVIARKDVPHSDVIKKVSITNDRTTNTQLIDSLTIERNEGAFGTPKKIKFPETNKHINIVKPVVHNGQWRASRGVAHSFLTDNTKQRVFGEAFIYMRTNTPTTRLLGDVFRGDIINIVTTEGWQLGYQVVYVSNDPSEIVLSNSGSTSEIHVVLIDDITNETITFKAVLSKVGDRI